MANHKQHIKAMATRFRVFRFTKEFYRSNGRVPTGQEISDELGISSGNALNHLNALNGADGMPKFKTGVGSRNSGLTAPETIGQELAMHRGHRFDENAVPLDILLSD